MTTVQDIADAELPDDYLEAYGPDRNMQWGTLFVGGNRPILRIGMRLRSTGEIWLKTSGTGMMSRAEKKVAATFRFHGHRTHR